MNTWTVTTSDHAHSRTIIGTSDNPDHARSTQLDVVRHQIASATNEHALPRYTLQQDGELVAIIQTGRNPAGQPDHAGVQDILNRIAHTNRR